MAGPAWLVTAAGVAGTACWALLLAPQALKNAQKASTEGLSLSLVVIWHLAGAVGAGYFAMNLSSNFWACLSFTLFGFFACFIESQVFVYGRAFKVNRTLQLLGMTALMIMAQISTSLVCLFVFPLIPDEASYALGNLGPSLLLVLGFFPQIWEFVSSRSVEGYSFGVTILDVVGCAFNCIVLYVGDDAPLSEITMDAAPFLSIVFMHAVLVVTAGVVVISQRSQARKCPVDKDGGVVDVEANSSCADSLSEVSQQ